jgi:hypothetical protein
MTPLGLALPLRLCLLALPALFFLRVYASRTSVATLARRADHIFETGNLFSAHHQSRSTRLTPLVLKEAEAKAAHYASVPLPSMRMPRWIRHAPLALMLGIAFAFAPGRLSAPDASLITLIEQAEAMLDATQLALQKDALPRDQRDSLSATTRELKQAIHGKDQGELHASMVRMEELLKRLTGQSFDASASAPRNGEDGNSNQGSPKSRDQEQDLRELLVAMLLCDPSEWKVRSELTQVREHKAMGTERDQADLKQAEESLSSGDGLGAQLALTRVLRRLDERRQLLQGAVDVLLATKGAPNASSGSDRASHEMGASTEAGDPHSSGGLRTQTSSVPQVPHDVELSPVQRTHLDRYFRTFPLATSPPNRR